MSSLAPRWVLRLSITTALVGIAGGAAGISVFVVLHLVQIVAFGFPFETSREAADEPNALHRLIALAVAGIIEGFVTAQPWPWPVKIGIGAAALAAFLFYMIFVGGRAARRGETGDVTEYESGTPTLVSG